MKTYQSQKQKEASIQQKLKEQQKQIEVQTLALQRIADTYDNVEDLAGVIARETLDTFR
jgi:hypothetical protein